jgi:hypothetical protein
MGLCRPVAGYLYLLLLLFLRKHKLIFCKKMGMNLREEKVMMWKFAKAYFKVLFWHSSEHME